MRQYALLFLLLLITVPTTATASNPNAGFVEGFWFSDSEPFADTPVRVYVALRNNTGGDLTGTVTFFADGDTLGTQQITALDNRIIESWVDWTPSYGEHALTAKLTRGTVSSADRGETTITLSAAEGTIFVDRDTDGDGVGNKSDIDDDGDGQSDETEISNGTDPLVFDEPPAVAEPVNTPATTATSSDSTTPPAGFEQYLTPSRVDTFLENITEWASSTKEKIDMYRETRATARDSDTSAPAVTVNSDGFGEISRSTDTNRTTRTDRAEPPNGFLGDLVRLMGQGVGGIITIMLMSLSWLLGNPLLLQLALLLLILSGIYSTARRLGRRPH